MLYFLLGKEGLQLFDNKGFMFVEIIASITLMLTFIMVFVPLSTLLIQEKKTLAERRQISSFLHDELQKYIWNGKEIPSSYATSVQSLPVRLQFSFEGEYLKGCASWQNARNREEELCFYASIEE